MKTKLTILIIVLIAFTLVFLSACKKAEESKAKSNVMSEQVGAQGNNSNETTEADNLTKVISEVDDLTVTNDSLDLDLSVFG